MLEGSLTLMPGASPPDANPTIRVHFNVSMFAASGIKVEALALHNEPYKPFKGVKFYSRAGHFEIRT